MLKILDTWRKGQLLKTQRKSTLCFGEFLVSFHGELQLPDVVSPETQTWLREAHPLTVELGCCRS